MDTAAFESDLRRDGFTQIETRNVPSKPMTPPHAHDFDVRALVLGGDITIICEGATRVYRAGEVFTMAAGCEHSEAFGTNGLSYVLGLRHRA